MQVSRLLIWIREGWCACVWTADSTCRTLFSIRWERLSATHEWQFLVGQMCLCQCAASNRLLGSERSDASWMVYRRVSDFASKGEEPSDFRCYFLMNLSPLRDKKRCMSRKIQEFDIRARVFPMSAMKSCDNYTAYLGDQNVYEKALDPLWYSQTLCGSAVGSR